MRKANEEVLAGNERCWPIGVPGFVIYSLIESFYFYQTPEKVTIINPGGPEVRHIYMNVPHSAVGIDRPLRRRRHAGHRYHRDHRQELVDNYRTPHTTKLHVVERLKLIEDGKALQISITVDDPGAFIMPWSATQRWRRVSDRPFSEMICAENRPGPRPPK